MHLVGHYYFPPLLGDTVQPTHETGLSIQCTDTANCRYRCAYCSPDNKRPLRDLSPCLKRYEFIVRTPLLILVLFNRARRHFRFMKRLHSSFQSIGHLPEIPSLQLFSRIFIIVFLFMNAFCAFYFFNVLLPHLQKVGQICSSDSPCLSAFFNGSSSCISCLAARLSPFFFLFQICKQVWEAEHRAQLKISCI